LGIDLKETNPDKREGTAAGEFFAFWSRRPLKIN